MCGVPLKMFTSKHPQTDDSTKRMNRIVLSYLRCSYNYHQTSWADLQPGAEYTYNSATIDSMEISSFKADLGWHTASLLDILINSKEPTIQCVVDLKARSAFSLDEGEFALIITQACQSAYNQRRYNPTHYAVGDKMLLSRKRFTIATLKTEPSERLRVRH